MARILHVTGCHAGGISRAISARIRAAATHEHHLLWAGTEAPDPQDNWASSTQMSDGFFNRVSELRKHVNQLRPAVLHAHSSWAGVYARLFKLNCPIAYEPHCFKFDDPGIAPLARLVFRQAERILARRTSAIGTLSEHETALAHSLDPTIRSVRIPNTPTVPVRPQDAAKRYSTVAMVGRLCPQKDPSYLLFVVRELQKLNSPINPVWIGDGETRFRETLISAGVEVTGWADKQTLAGYLSNAVYVHTAAYEGFPLSVLDAAACGAPIIARRIPALHEAPVLQAESPAAVARLIDQVRIPGPMQDQAFENNQLLLANYNAEHLEQQLAVLYAVALEP